MTNNPEKIGIFIPAYNEENSIETVLTNLRELNKSIPVFIIDDGSKDNTRKIVETYGFNLIKHPMNLGGGAAIKTAFVLARKLGFKYVITLDADGQHDPTIIPQVLEMMHETEAGLFIGSRFIDPKQVSMEKYREIGIKFFSWYSTFLTGQRITDVTNCFRIYDMEKVSEILNDFNEKQYYAIGLVVRLARRGVQIVEFEVEDIPRIGGESKKGVLRYLYNLLRIIIMMTFSF
jgi:glycosyltransferase involved in cell wall biosynthesis